LRQLLGFRGESQLRTWSLGIALNVVRETRRKRKARQLDLNDDETAATPRVARLPEDENVGSELERQEQISMLKRTLDALPERQREAIVLRFFEDLSVEQTAAAMHCAEGTVKATVFQALRTLRDRMKMTS